MCPNGELTAVYQLQSRRGPDRDAVRPDPGQSPLRAQQLLQSDQCQFVQVSMRLIGYQFAQFLSFDEKRVNAVVLIMRRRPLRSKRQSSTPLPRPLVPGDEGYVRMAHDTIEELDWCLDQLETIQTHRSVSDMASLKVRKLVLSLIQ